MSQEEKTGKEEAEEWVLTPSGFGVLKKVESEDGVEMAEVKLAVGTIFCPQDQLRREVEIRIKTFAEFLLKKPNPIIERKKRRDRLKKARLEKLKKQKQADDSEKQRSVSACIQCACETFVPDKWKPHICNPCRHSDKSHGPETLAAAAFVADDKSGVQNPESKAGANIAEDEKDVEKQKLDDAQNPKKSQDSQNSEQQEVLNDSEASEQKAIIIKSPDTDEQVDAHASENVDKQNQENADQPNQENVDQPNQENADQPNQENSDQPNQENADQPNQENADQPNQENADQPNQENADQPNQENADQPNQENADQPNQENADQPSQENADQPNQENPDQPSQENVQLNADQQKEQVAAEAEDRSKVDEQNVAQSDENVEPAKSPKEQKSELADSQLESKNNSAISDSGKENLKDDENIKPESAKEEQSQTSSTKSSPSPPELQLPDPIDLEELGDSEDEEEISIPQEFQTQNVVLVLKLNVTEKLELIRDKIAQRFDVLDENIRLYHRGIELHDPLKTIAETNILPPHDLIFIYEESGIFFMDQSGCGPNITLSADSLSASIQSCNKWHVVRGDHEFNTGLHSWEVQLDRCSAGNILIGVSEYNVNLQSWLGGDAHGWGYLGNKTLWWKGQKHKSDYGEPFETGDVIGVHLDMNARNVIFSKNGKQIPGVAFDNLPASVFPAFALYTSGDKISLQNFQKGRRATFRTPGKEDLVQMRTAENYLVTIDVSRLTLEQISFYAGDRCLNKNTHLEVTVVGVAIAPWKFRHQIFVHCPSTGLTGLSLREFRNVIELKSSANGFVAPKEALKNEVLSDPRCLWKKEPSDLSLIL